MFPRWTQFNRLGHLWHWILDDHHHLLPASLMNNTLPERFLLWVDGVGGYLVCMSDEITLGQATPGTAVDIPILADLSGKHATFHRQGENYLIEPWGDVFLHGNRVKEPTLLTNNDLLTLGSDIELRFRTPHPLSATACLEFTNHYRTEPRSDAILLISQSLILGPDNHNHVVCHQWPENIVLFQEDSRLYCRSSQAMNLDGRPLKSTTPVQCGQRISLDGCAISLEEV
ncbi:MAG: FHA domain-containing protein [Planctomycetota bacterium]|nr:FHA domain-containing protein [Planctomycetota bacterium]